MPLPSHNTPHERPSRHQAIVAICRGRALEHVHLLEYTHVTRGGLVIQADLAAELGVIAHLTCRLEQCSQESRQLVELLDLAWGPLYEASTRRIGA